MQLKSEPLQQDVASQQHNKSPMSLVAFFVLLFVVTWPGALPMILSSYKIEIPGPLRLLQILMLFGPALVAGFAAYREGGIKELRRLLGGLLVWKVNVLWYAAVLAGPALLFAAAMFATEISGAGTVRWPTPDKFITTFGTVLAVYFCLNTEEIAWRGYALPRLQSRIGTLQATLIIGVLWAVFHLPLFLMRGGHPAGYPVWLFLLMIFTFAIPFTSVYNRTGGSILLAHLFHQSINAASEALPFFPVASKSLAPVLFTVAGAMIISAILLAAKKIEPRNRNGA